MEEQEKAPASGATSKSNQSRSKVASFIRGLYHKLWFRASYIFLILFLSFSNLLLSWFVFVDLFNQEAGLVYDETPTPILALFLAFNILELVFFAIDLLLWINIFWNEIDAWFCVDLGNAFNIFMSELPLVLLNAYICACHESTLSTSILIKSTVLLVYLLLRLVTFTTVYLLDTTTEEGCDPISVMESMNMYSRLGDYGITKLRSRFFEIIRRRNLRKAWFVVRVFVVAGFLAMIITNILIFKFSFIQMYKGHLEWRRIVPSANGSLEDIMAERYFHDVEIFMKETEISTRKWLHLVSLEKIMQLQNIGATEQIGISYIKWNSEVYCLFSQLIMYKNGTTDSAMTCWRVLGIDYFRETSCQDIMDDRANVVSLKKLKVTFTYKPPSANRHLGMVYYNATRTNKNGTVFVDVPLKLEYFRNTIAHNLGLSKPGGIPDDDAAQNHDGWTSGPFRPMDAYWSDRGPFGKYDPDAGDLVRISDIWKTGLAMCPSTAPTGPRRLSDA